MSDFRDQVVSVLYEYKQMYSGPIRFDSITIAQKLSYLSRLSRSQCCDGTPGILPRRRHFPRRQFRLPRSLRLLILFIIYISLQKSTFTSPPFLTLYSTLFLHLYIPLQLCTVRDRLSLLLHTRKYSCLLRPAAAIWRTYTGK